MTKSRCSEAGNPLCWELRSLWATAPILPQQLENSGKSSIVHLFEKLQYVPFRDYPDELVGFHDRKTVNIMLVHQSRRLVDVAAYVHRDDLLVHYLTHPRLEELPQVFRVIF